MKGLILAAGRGLRLKPLTDRRPKPLTSLANRPLIHYSIDKLMEVGIDDIGIVISPGENDLRKQLSYLGAHFTFLEQTDPRGIAHAVSVAHEFTCKDDFVLLFCDNLYGESLEVSLEEWQELRRGSDASALIHVHRVPDPRGSGVAVLRDGWVQELEEKPLNPKSNLAVLGIYFFTPEIYSAIEKVQPSARGELEITDALAFQIQSGKKIRALETSAFWVDTGTFHHLLLAQSYVMSDKLLKIAGGELRDTKVLGNVGVSRNCKVTSSLLVGPTIIADGCEIINSSVGPNAAIANGCYIENCELADCQVYPGTKLTGIQARGVIFDGDIRIDVS